MAFGEELLLSTCLTCIVPWAEILFYFMSPCIGCLGCCPIVGPITSGFFGMCTNYISMGGQILANLPMEWIGVCQMICPIAGAPGAVPALPTICPENLTAICPAMAPPIV
jgi:hypothetical protein